MVLLSLINRQVRSTIFGKLPRVPLVPRHMMDLYQWRDPLRYSKICGEQSVYDFDVHLRNVQMLRQVEPLEFEKFQLRSRFFFYDYGAFLYPSWLRRRRRYWS